jgi:uncharacterized protein (TIGR02284 family)
MSNLRSHDIQVLDDLIKVTLESALGYEKAAEEVPDTRFKALFEEQAIERRQVRLYLQTLARSLGAEPAEEGSVLSALRRGVSALTGGGKAMLGHVEAGEDAVAARFEAALQDPELSVEVKQAVAEEYGIVKAGHDRMQGVA